jgi:hypothetical protein
MAAAVALASRGCVICRDERVVGRMILLSKV